MELCTHSHTRLNGVAIKQLLLYQNRLRWHSLKSGFTGGQQALRRSHSHQRSETSRSCLVSGGRDAQPPPLPNEKRYEMCNSHEGTADNSVPGRRAIYGNCTGLHRAGPQLATATEFCRARRPPSSSNQNVHVPVWPPSFDKWCHFMDMQNR